jgi:hypothetical protein
MIKAVIVSGGSDVTEKKVDENLMMNLSMFQENIRRGSRARSYKEEDVDEKIEARV